MQLPTPDSHLYLSLWSAKCSPTLSPPACRCALWLQCVVLCVCVCVSYDMVSNRWSNLIHASFVPRCPLALTVRWWCYLGLTGILSASFPESDDPALPRSALLPPSLQPEAADQTHTDPTRDGTLRSSRSRVTRLLWVKLCPMWQRITYSQFCFSSVMTEMKLFEGIFRVSLCLFPSCKPNYEDDGAGIS